MKKYINAIKTETFKDMKMEISFNTSSELEGLTELFQFIEANDSYIVKIEYFEDKFIPENRNTENSEFLEYIKNYKAISMVGDVIKTTIIVNKKIGKNGINMYSLDKFYDYFNNLTVEEEISVLQKIIEVFVFDQDKRLRFNLINDNENFYSDKFVFAKNRKFNIETIDINYDVVEELKNNVNNIGKFFISSEPGWFYFRREDKSGSNNLFEIFDMLTIFMSIIYISDSYFLENNTLKYNINGYKPTSYEINKTNFEEHGNINEAAKILYELYKWIYSDKSRVSDKLGITRNILSIKSEKFDILNITEQTVNSIKSSYDIYLKENVDRYIGVLNDTTTFLSNLNLEMYQKASEFSSAFKENLTGALVLIFSTLASQLLDGNIQSIFTIIFPVVLFIYILFTIALYKISLKQLTRDLKRYKNVLETQKKQYSKILNEEDLKGIFDESISFEESEKYILNSSKPYKIIWLIMIILLIIIMIIFLLYNRAEYVKCIDTIKQLFF